jgi:polyhydroxybutyrate depolymerase
MMKPGIYLQVIILSLFAIFACKKEKVPIGYYPHANRMDTLIHDGITRTYILHVPASYSAATKVALVIGLHGHTTFAATAFEGQSQFSVKADAEGFIVAYPNALHYPWDTENSQVWNAGGQYEEWTGRTDDVGFINQMIDLICKYYAIDASRIYVTGHSNGSRMTYRVGYELSKKIAAIAPHSGQMLDVPTRKMDTPVPVLHLHALDDNVVNYNGSIPSSNPNDLQYLPVDMVLRNWAANFSCNTLPDTIFTNSDYIVKEWKCSEGGPDIKLYSAKLGEHHWFTTANSGISATDVIWDFFKAHPKKL